MRLPINTDGMWFVVAKPPKPVTVFGSQGEVKQDRDGNQIYSMDVLAVSADDAEVLQVKLPGPVEAQEKEPVVVRGLTAEHWEMTDNRGEKRSGISYRAAGLDRPTMSTNGGGKQVRESAAAAKG